MELSFSSDDISTSEESDYHTEDISTSEKPLRARRKKRNLPNHLHPSTLPQTLALNVRFPSLVLL